MNAFTWHLTDASRIVFSLVPCAFVHAPLLSHLRHVVDCMSWLCQVLILVNVSSGLLLGLRASTRLGLQKTSSGVDDESTIVVPPPPKPYVPERGPIDADTLTAEEMLVRCDSALDLLSKEAEQGARADTSDTSRGVSCATGHDEKGESNLTQEGYM